MPYGAVNTSGVNELKVATRVPCTQAIEEGYINKSERGLHNSAVVTERSCTPVACLCVYWTTYTCDIFIYLIRLPPCLKAKRMMTGAGGGGKEMVWCGMICVVEYYVHFLSK